MEKENYKILLIDDDQAVFSSVSSALSRYNFSVFWEHSPEITKVLKSISLYKPDIILLDIIFDGENHGKSLLQAIKKTKHSQLPVIMLTNTMKDLREEDYLLAASLYAKEGFSVGERAYDVFAKQIKNVIDGVSKLAPDDPRFGFVVGNTNAMQDVCRQILKLGFSDATVLITGETGTGKELTAKAVHSLSTRKEKKFLAVDCGTFPDDNLLVSALFGHVKGAFTGANEKEWGYLKQQAEAPSFLMK